MGRWIAGGLLGLGLLGCLAAFGPDVRARGVHAGLATQDPGGGDGSCMSCHESEAEALARMHAEGSTMAPERGAEPGPPLVADWMVADERACTHCHRIRE